MKKSVVVAAEDILLMLSDSVSKVLSAATHSHVGYSAMVQKINKTCLRPDIGCFVLFDGAFSGLVVTNFSAAAAMEIYHDYMTGMGMSKDDLSQNYTSDDVSNVMGELMNQVVGDFTNKVAKHLRTTITQSQPKMLSINRQISLSIDANLDRPQARRVSFNTQSNHIFYLELAMDKTEFIQLAEFEEEDQHPDSIFEEAVRHFNENQESAQKTEPKADDDADDLLRELGI